MLSLDGLNSTLLLGVAARIEILLKIPFSIQAEAELRMFGSHVHRLANRTALDGGDFSLEIGISDVDMDMGNNKNRPFLSRTDRLLEMLLPSIDTYRDDSLGLRIELMNQKLGLLIAKVISAAQFNTIVPLRNAQLCFAPCLKSSRMANEYIYAFEQLAVLLLKEDGRQKLHRGYPGGRLFGDAVEFDGVVIQPGIRNGFRRLFDNLQSNGIGAWSKVASGKYKINVR